MAVSLGVRVSGLFVIGAVAVAAAAFGTHGDDTARGNGSGARSVSPASPSSSPGDGGEIGTATSAAPPRIPASGNVASPKGAGESEVPGGTGTPVPSRTPVSSPTPSRTTPGGPTMLTAPNWLPPGPVSPDSDGAPDPAAVYDDLRSPDRCADARNLIPAAPGNSASADEWGVLRGLAAACLAVQGKGGDWGVAVAGWSGAADDALSCKGRAARQILGGLLDFHRRHPTATVRLEASSGGKPACAYGIGAVDVGGDGEAAPGDTISVELRDAYFDPAELLGGGEVFVGGQEVVQPPVLVSASGDRLVLSVVVPGMATGAGAGSSPSLSAHPVDLLVRYGTAEAVKKDAFLLVPPEQQEPVGPSPGDGTGSPTPQRQPGPGRPHR
ncbi:hypothetical protein ACFYXF_41525 [Streptomyces sp. NPDC002680]|uniref:hypothetical protein n=1 Tax=Streptomyces sp. NPDC002680 TaxID=3364659 RepID=UPI0036B69836